MNLDRRTSTNSTENSSATTEQQNRGVSELIHQSDSGRLLIGFGSVRQCGAKVWTSFLTDGWIETSRAKCLGKKLHFEKAPRKRPKGLYRTNCVVTDLVFTGEQSLFAGN